MFDLSFLFLKEKLIYFTIISIIVCLTKRDRLMIPILDAKSRLIGFGGRVMDQRASRKKDASARAPAKYINSPTSALFSKRHTLFGLPESLPYLRSAAEAPVFLVEGYFDVISLHQCGVYGALACLGTSLTREQLLLAAYAGIEGRLEEEAKPRPVILLLDEDVAGQKAMHRFCSEVCQLILLLLYSLLLW